MGMEVAAVEADDAGGFLAAMLQRVQAECGAGRSIGDVPDAENAAFLVQLVVLRRSQGHADTLLDPRTFSAPLRGLAVSPATGRPLPCRDLLAGH